MVTQTADRSQGGVLVTGAGARVGAHTARAIGESGRPVAVHFNRSRAGADETVAHILAAGGRAAAVGGDLSNEDELATLVTRASAALAVPITGLVNNASTFEADTLSSMTRDSWDHHMQANLRAPCVLTQALARALPAGLDAAVVNLIDQRIKKPTPQFFTYALSKAGLAWATVTMAQELAPRVRVNAVAPGPTLRNARQSEADWETQKAATLLETGSPVEAVVDAIMFLLNAAATTGQVLVVDGGQHLAWKTADVWGISE